MIIRILVKSKSDTDTDTDWYTLCKTIDIPCDDDTIDLDEEYIMGAYVVQNDKMK